MGTAAVSRRHGLRPILLTPSLVGPWASRPSVPKGPQGPNVGPSFLILAFGPLGKLWISKESPTYVCLYM